MVNYLLFYKYTVKKLSRIILVVVMLISVNGKLYYFRDTAHYFRYLSGFDLPTLSSFLSILVLFELLIMLVIIFQYENYGFIYYPVLVFFLVMLGMNISFLIRGIENCACFGVGIRSSPALSIIKCLMSIVCMMILRLNSKTKGIIRP